MSLIRLASSCIMYHDFGGILGVLFSNGSQLRTFYPDLNFHQTILERIGGGLFSDCSRLRTGIRSLILPECFGRSWRSSVLESVSGSNLYSISNLYPNLNFHEHF